MINSEKKGRGERIGTADLDSWASYYNDFYPQATRVDREYRLSRMLVLTGRAWTTLIDNKLRLATGQSRARWQTLFAIAFAPQPAMMTELGVRLNVQWPTLVRVVDGLATDGLIERIDNPHDGRSKLVSLTEAGADIVRQIQPILDHERRTILADLDEEELVACAAMLKRVLQRVRTGRSKAD